VTVRFRRAALLLALLAPVVVTASLSEGRVQDVFPLPRYTEPGGVAVAGNGSVWVTSLYGGLTRLGPDGRTTDALGSTDEYMADVTSGPDGSIWAAADESGLVSVSPAGTVATWPVPRFGWAEAVTATRAGVWFVNSGNIGAGYLPRIERIGEDGAMRQFVDHVPRDWLSFNAVTASPDGSLWFTEVGSRRAWIGHMTAAGLFANVQLPKRFGEARGIVAATDGSVWFAAYHAIGRISASGRITRYPLPRDLNPNGLTLGGDGAPWFTSDLCVGRISASGGITTWRVPGASQLIGIAAGRHGTFWLADRIGNVIRHFSPSVVAPQLCGAATLTRHSGKTRATLTYQAYGRYDGVEYFNDIRIRIARAGKTLFSEMLRSPMRDFGAYSDSTSLAVRDLDGDGEPEVTLLLNWNGAHCCSWSRIYRYDPRRNAFIAQTHWWGEGGAEPRVRDLNGDGRPEFISFDDRFDEVFTAFVGSARPIQIWSYDHSTFNDVTRRYPKLIRRDAAELWRLYRKNRATDARGLLPAWVADEDMLGRAAVADRVLHTAARRGYLKSHGFAPTSAHWYLWALKRLLHRTGYA
jgi:streptogramin lyase